VCASAEEIDEHNFLFGVEVSANRQHLVVGAVGVEGGLLGALRWFKFPRMALWF